MKEWEARWDEGRRYFSTKREALEYAKNRNIPELRIIEWGHGAIVWPAANDNGRL